VQTGLHESEQPRLGARLLREIAAHSSRVNSVVFTPEGDAVVSGGADAEVRLFPITAPADALLPHFTNVVEGTPLAVTTISASQAAQALILAHHANPGALVNSTPVPTARQLRLNDFSPGAQLVGHMKDTPSAAFSPDGKRIATASLDDTVRIWDATTGEQVLQAIGHLANSSGILPGGVWSVAFAPDGRTIATGGSDHTVRIWDISVQGKFAKPLELLKEHEGLVFAVDYTRSNLLASGSEDATVLLWDVNTWRVVRRLTNHKGWVVSVKSSRDGAMLVTASWDWSAKVWDVTSGTELLSLVHPGPVHSAAISNDGSHLATGCEDGYVRIWRLTGPSHQVGHAPD